MARRNQAAADAAAEQANQAAEPAVSDQTPAVDASEAGRILRSQRDKPEEPKGRAQPRNEARHRQEEEIENRHYSDEDQGYGEPKPLVEDEQKPVEAPPAADTPAPVVVSDPPPSDAQPPVVSAPVVKVKVDGQEFEVPQSDVDEAGGLVPYQKQRAAENRQQKLEERIAETKQQMALMQQFMLQQQQPQPQQPTPQEMQQRQKDLSDKMIYAATPEDRVAAFQELQRLNSPQFDPNQFEYRLMAKLAIKSAAEAFTAEFADVMANPDLAMLARFKEEKMLSGFQQLPADLKSEYRKIGNELRVFVKGNTSPAQLAAVPTTGNTSLQTTSNTSQSTSAKDERKSSNIGSLPQSGARATAPEQKELTEKEERAAYFASEKKARNQPTG